MDLSVIIPHSNRVAELRATLESFGPQADAIELIVANVGDPIAADELPVRARVWNGSGPWSLGRARNRGAAVATGERLFFLDCDITVGPDFAALAIERIGRKRGWAPIVRNSSSRHAADVKGYRTYGYGNVGVSSEDFADIGGFDELDGWGAEDWLFKWKCERLRIRLFRDRSNLVHRDHDRKTTWHRLKVPSSVAQEIRRKWSPPPAR
ncbi:MAG TPA: glycosyltransferase family A protein [Tepidisphaeraceae bacterium]|nr:glycosyltransferase family A protein [Tepidisphaeraceae bacterium]